MRVFETKFKEEELENVVKVLKEGNLGFGSNVSNLESVYKFFSKKPYNTATNSASASAFMIFAYLKEIYGVCDVYTPSLGFTSPAWAAKHFGHNLIFVEVNDNLLFDCHHYHSIRKQTKNKKVLMPILYGGVSTINNWDIVGDEIVVVDSAHCVTPTIKSHFTFFSFHPYKPICSSDGGMISTDIKIADDYFKSYRNFGRINTKKTYDINANESISINSGFINEAMKVTFEELLVSNLVWMTKDSTVFPMKVADSSLSFKTSLNDKLINYAINFEYAFDLINNVH